MFVSKIKMKLYGTILRNQNAAVNEMAAELRVNAGTVSLSSVPETFDGRIVWSDYLSPILNQYGCGGCYSFSITSVLSDKYAMYTRNQVRPVLNPLWSIMCHTSELTKQEQRALKIDEEYRKSKEAVTTFTACKGGTLYEMARFYYRLGAVADSCVSLNVIQRGIDTTGQLPMCSAISGTAQNQCQEVPGQQRKAVRVWPISDYYVVSQSEDLETIANYMKYDLCTRGPLIAGFNMYDDFLTYDGKSVYSPKPNQTMIGGHAIKVVGWGTTQEGRYWICANSWGEQWGEKGYFRLAMANRLLETELNHLSIIPQVPGIMKNFQLSKQSSSVRELDRFFREDANINPFTLYDAATTKLIKYGVLGGTLNPPVFMQLDYELDHTIFLQSEPVIKSVWLDPMTRTVAMALVGGAFVSLGLLLGFLWVVLFSK